MSNNTELPLQTDQTQPITEETENRLLSILISRENQKKHANSGNRFDTKNFLQTGGSKSSQGCQFSCRYFKQSWILFSSFYKKNNEVIEVGIEACARILNTLYLIQHFFYTEPKAFLCFVLLLVKIISIIVSWNKVKEYFLKKVNTFYFVIIVTCFLINLLYLHFTIVQADFSQKYQIPKSQQLQLAIQILHQNQEFSQNNKKLEEQKESLTNQQYLQKYQQINRQLEVQNQQLRQKLQKLLKLQNLTKQEFLKTLKQPIKQKQPTTSQNNYSLGPSRLAQTQIYQTTQKETLSLQ